MSLLEATFVLVFVAVATDCAPRLRDRYAALRSMHTGPVVTADHLATAVAGWLWWLAGWQAVQRVSAVRAAAGRVKPHHALQEIVRDPRTAVGEALAVPLGRVLDDLFWRHIERRKLGHFGAPPFSARGNATTERARGF